MVRRGEIRRDADGNPGEVHAAVCWMSAWIMSMSDWGHNNPLNAVIALPMPSFYGEGIETLKVLQPSRKKAVLCISGV